MSLCVIIIVSLFRLTNRNHNNSCHAGQHKLARRPEQQGLARANAATNGAKQSRQPQPGRIIALFAIDIRQHLNSNDWRIIMREESKLCSYLLTPVVNVPAQCARGNFVVYRARSSTNRRPSLLCRRTTSMDRLPTGLKQLQSTDSFSRQLKTFLFQSVYGHWRTNWWFCDAHLDFQ